MEKGYKRMQEDLHMDFLHLLLNHLEKNLALELLVHLVHELNSSQYLVEALQARSESY